MTSVPGENHLKVLRTNIAAVRAIVETVAGTLGPKGLDVLLVDDIGRITLTNDGVEILSQLDAQHPAARLVIQAAVAQDRAVGDGTTTATVLAGALLDAGLDAIERGIAVNPLLAGLKAGVRAATEAMEVMAKPIGNLDDPRLIAATRIAARGDESIADVVLEAARQIGAERLRSGELRLGELVLSQVGTPHRCMGGLLIGKLPLQLPPEDFERTGGIFVLADHLEPETIDAQALGTEGGFTRFLEAQESLRRGVELLVKAGVVLVVCEKGIAPIAEDMLAEAGIVALQRVLRRDSERIVSFTAARPARRRSLERPAEILGEYLGQATVQYDRSTNRVILTAGAGLPMATILVGAVNTDVAAELERVAIDAAGALQSALRGGTVTGGGVAEFVAARPVMALAARTEGLTRYGIEAAAIALRRPLAQIALNSGFSGFELVARLEAVQERTGNYTLGLDCDSGELVDLEAAGVVDPLLVKTHALAAAAEIAERILRIQTVVRKREIHPNDS